MLKIYLVRHGQDEDNATSILNGHRDTPLTEIGIAQARETAAKLLATGITFDQAYASPLQRAYKTAEVITETLGLPAPEIMPELIERDFGIMTGKHHVDIVPMCAPDILQSGTITYFLRPDGAETFPALLARGKRVLKLLEAKHASGTILLVLHGDIGKMIYAAYYDLSWRDVLTQFHFGNSDLLELSPESSATDAHVHKITQYNM